MATPRNAPKAGEIWHLSIEDLFQPVTEAQRLGGDGPFVINLSVSTAPIDTPAKVFDACRDAHIYQIQVTEDGRTRYRLRLGPFASEDQADAVLAEVRETYPGALTATAGTFDLRAIASMQPQVEPKKSDEQIPAPASDLKAAGARNAEDASREDSSRQGGIFGVRIRNIHRYCVAHSGARASPTHCTALGARRYGYCSAQYRKPAHFSSAP